MFFRGSRYLKVDTYECRHPTTGTATVKQCRACVETTAGIVYQVKEGDRLDLLAQQFYRTPRKWWLICDANPEYLHPDELMKPGNRIVIPRDQVV